MGSESSSVKFARMEEHVKNLEVKVDQNHIDTTKQITEVKSEIQHLSVKIEAGAVNALAIKTLGEKHDVMEKEVARLKRHKWILPTIVGVLTLIGAPLFYELIKQAIFDKG